MQTGIDIQRAVTIALFQKRRILAPAIWLRPESILPGATDLHRPPDTLTTDINEWVEDDPRNLGVRLSDGFLELQVHAPDDRWVVCLFEAAQRLGVDARAAYGATLKPISSILLRVEDPASIEAWTHMWPRGAKDQNDCWIETRVVSSLIPPKGPPIWRDAAPLPGSVYGGRLIVWRPGARKIAEDAYDGMEAFGAQAIAVTDMESICRAVAYGTLLYWILTYLDGIPDWGPSLVRTIGGWIARVEREGADINARGKSLEGVCWSPIFDEGTAMQLVRFLEEMGADELEFYYKKFSRDLEGGSMHAPGWPALETTLGMAARLAIRRAFRAGPDIDLIEQMADRYILDTSEHVYIDREAIALGLPFEKKHDDLVRIYENESIFVNKKRYNPFRLYAASKMRTDVRRVDMFPTDEPGAILRISPVHGILKNEENWPDEYRALNNFTGFVIKPVGSPDPQIMTAAVSMLDRMLGLLTQDNDAQMDWLKKWLAWIIQHPGIKQQSAPVIIGGQGIGKSLFGDELMKALFGGLASSTSGAQLTDNSFLITPFIGALVTFIDEVKLEAVSAINEIKKIIRSTRLSGQVKHQHQREYFIPSRLIIASNTVNIGLTPEDAADRALFFIMAWTAENKKMTDREFLNWSMTLKPFYAEFVEALGKAEVRQHLMRYFTDLECTRAELEDLTLSSRNDEAIVRSTMSKARSLARAMVADARILQRKDLTAYFDTSSIAVAIKRIDARSTVEPSSVMMEFERAGLLETIRHDQRKFRWGYGRTVQLMSEAHGLPITPNFDFQPGDFDLNPVLSSEGAPDWRGEKEKKWKNRQNPYDRDPDYLPSE